MGSLLNRSSSQEDVKVRKDKRKQRRNQQLERSFDPDAFVIHDGKENIDPNINFTQTYEYELWDKEFDQQQMMNINDPPGAPRTHSSNHSGTRTDILTRSWPPAHDINNSFYPTNSHRMTPPYNMSHMLNQYNDAQIPNMIDNKSKIVVPEERPSKKVQFFSSIQQQQQQQQTPALKPLVSTRSWHEFSNMYGPTTIKSMPLSNKSSIPRSTAVLPKMSPTQTPVEKPIYVGIDHKATLAERGQTVAHKRHRKNGEKTPSDGSNSSISNHQTRSHTNHQHKHQRQTDSPKININTIPNKSFDSFQPKSSHSQSLLKNNLSQNIEQNSFIPNEIRPTKSSNNHRQKPSSLNNEIKPLKNQENHRQHRHHRQHHRSTHTNDSPLNNTQSSLRRIESKQSGTPVMRIPLSQFNHQHQKQPITLSLATTTTSIIRTRV